MNGAQVIRFGQQITLLTGEFVDIFKRRIGCMHARHQNRTYILLPDVFDICAFGISEVETVK